MRDSTVSSAISPAYWEKISPCLFRASGGSKTPRKDVTWSRYTRESLKADTKESLHYIEQFKLAILEDGNLAVKLGKESGGGLVVDFDTNDDAVIGSFLRHNPEFTETLRTRGSRGCAFWYRATGYYPTGVFNIEVPEVGRVGELRCGNRLATVWGKNAAGADYVRLVDAPLIAFDYKGFRWEAGWNFVESKKESRVRIDWDRFNEMVRDEDGGIVEALVARYFPGAVFKEGRWCCGNIGGETRGKGQGSFRIKPDGLCQDFDGSFSPTGIINALLSAQREEATGEPLTLEEIFAAIKEDTGEDFILTPEAVFDRDLVFLKTRFAYATTSDEFYFDHGSVWGAVKDSRTDLILAQDLGISGEGKAATLDAYQRIIMRECPVSVAVNIAGYPKGIHLSTTGRPFLVLEPTETPAPIRGDWRPIKRLLGGMLGPFQTCLFHCWMKWGMEALRDGTLAPGHYLVLMGPAACGKTLTQEKLISPLLGCGPTDSTSYLTGVSDFNSDLMGSFHWMISDGLTFRNYQERKNYTEKVKRQQVNSVQRLHSKYKNAGNFSFNCRLSHTLNPAATENLPLFEEGMVDKMLVLCCSPHRYLPSAVCPRPKYEAALKGALNAYAYFLFEEFRIPEAIRETNGERFGFRGWINPVVLERTSDASREVALAEIIRKVYLAGIEYEDTPGDHHERLSNSKLLSARRYLDLCRNTQALGHLLNDLIDATAGGKPVLSVEVTRRKAHGLRLIKIRVLPDSNLVNTDRDPALSEEEADREKKRKNLAAIRSKLRGR
jgi:hypothetical protein